MSLHGRLGLRPREVFGQGKDGVKGIEPEKVAVPSDRGARAGPAAHAAVVDGRKGVRRAGAETLGKALGGRIDVDDKLVQPHAFGGGRVGRVRIVRDQHEGAGLRRHARKDKSGRKVWAFLR